MSKLTDALRTHKLINNWDALKKYGNAETVAVTYHAGTRWNTAHSEVWSPRPRSKLERDNKAFSPIWHKEFPGTRSRSFPEALKLANEICEHGMAPSPFGGYLPKELVVQLKMLTKEKPL